MLSSQLAMSGLSFAKKQPEASSSIQASTLDSVLPSGNKGDRSAIGNKGDRWRYRLTT